MPQGLELFLRDTAAFVPLYIVSSCAEDTLTREDSLILIAQCLQTVSSQIMELDDPIQIVIQVLDPHIHLELGGLGSYDITSTDENLSVVARRLKRIAFSDSFLRAILGL